MDRDDIDTNSFNNNQFMIEKGNDSNTHCSNNNEFTLENGNDSNTSISLAPKKGSKFSNDSKSSMQLITKPTVGPLVLAFPNDAVVDDIVIHTEKLFNNENDNDSKHK
jgi:hypothetical protein